MKNDTSPMMRSEKRKKMKKKMTNVTMLVARRGKKDLDMDLMASLSLMGRLK
jgi:hypothetical protein